VKVIVTGTDGRVAKRLRAGGIEVVECPLVRIEPLDGPPVRADTYDWVVLTSRKAVEQLFRRLEGGLPRVAVIGPGTAEALRAHGAEPTLVARRSTQEGLLEELPRPAGRVLFAGAEGARNVIVTELGADFLPLYRTVELQPYLLPEGDLAVLASASGGGGGVGSGAQSPGALVGPRPRRRGPPPPPAPGSRACRSVP
jgi:uroporphyrinogen-III synthase